MDVKILVRFISKLIVFASYMIMLLTGGFMMFGPMIYENTMTIVTQIAFMIGGFAIFLWCMEWNEPVRKFLGFSK